MVDGRSDRCLLILSCSARKARTPGTVRALDRYDGVFFRVLKKAQREGRVRSHLDIAILSAEFGLLDADQPIPYYDRRVTLKRARELQPHIADALAKRLTSVEYAEIFIVAGQSYRSVLCMSSELHRHPSVSYASGGIGQQMAGLKQWLAGSSIMPKDHPERAISS